MLACSGKKIYHFCFVLLCIRGQIPSTSPREASIRRGDLTEGVLRNDFGGLIFGGAYILRGLFLEFYGTLSLLLVLSLALRGFFLRFSPLLKNQRF